MKRTFNSVDYDDPEDHFQYCREQHIRLIALVDWGKQFIQVAVIPHAEYEKTSHGDAS